MLYDVVKNLPNADFQFNDKFPIIQTKISNSFNFKNSCCSLTFVIYNTISDNKSFNI